MLLEHSRRPLGRLSGGFFEFKGRAESGKAKARWGRRVPGLRAGRPAALAPGEQREGVPRATSRARAPGWHAPCTWRPGTSPCLPAPHRLASGQPAGTPCAGPKRQRTRPRAPWAQRPWTQTLLKHSKGRNPTWVRKALRGARRVRAQGPGRAPFPRFLAAGPACARAHFTAAAACSAACA